MATRSSRKAPAARSTTNPQQVSDPGVWEEKRLRATPKSLDTLFRTEAPRLARFFRRRVRDPDEVDDCVQEAFARMVSAKPAATLVNPEAYLQRIARNLVFNLTRRAAARPVTVALDTDMALRALVPADQAHALEARDLFVLYENAIDTLSPRSREVFLLHRIDELSYKQIAARLGIGVRTVEYHIAKALAHIDRKLSEA